MNIADFNSMTAPCSRCCSTRRAAPTGLYLALIALLSTSAILAPVTSLAASIPIGSEVQLELSDSALWRGFVGTAPATRSVQRLNPPIFRWTYMEHPEMSATPALRTFRLQIAPQLEFTSTFVDVVSSNNFYNLLSPITHDDHTTYTNTIYWRVVYMSADTSVNISTSVVRSFTLTPNAITWNRSMLSNVSYVTSACQHPHFLFCATNRSEVLRWCQTSQWKTAWGYISNSAFQTITQSWWNAPLATNVYEWPQRIAEVALVYQLTTNHTLLAADPAYAAQQYANYWLDNRLDQTEQPSVKVQLLALIYDWLYPIMSHEQQAKVREALEYICKYYLYSYWWFCDPPPADRHYKAPRSICLGSAALLGSSHPTRGGPNALMCSVAALGESAFMHEVFDYAINYCIGQHGPYVDDGGSINQGRGYLQSTVEWEKVGPVILASTVFKEASLERNPKWAAIVEYMMHMNPVLFREVNEPWGDLGGGRQVFWQDYYMRDLALFTQSGEGWRHYRRAWETRDRYVAPPNVFSLLIPYHYPPPREADSCSGFVDPQGGWAIASSSPPNAYGAFTNGIGFITHARPRGSEVNHSEFTDGEVQMWAYGASITDGGVGNYRKHPMYHNALLVDGIGVCLPQKPLHDWFSRLIAWTNSPVFTYVGMDITRSFNRSNFTVGGYGLNPAFATFYTSHRVPHVSSVQRHIVFPRKKYWVIYDQLETTRNATFSWKWNVVEPTAEVDAGNCRFYYTASNHYNGRNVGVHVAHVVDPGTMVMTHLSGTNFARYNPITGEDYSLTDGDTVPRWNHTIWVSNREKTTNWHFLTAVYPVKWDSDSVPSIIRINDNAVRVVNGGEDDTISFERSGTNVVVVLDFKEGAGVAPSAPDKLRVLDGS